MTFQSHVRRFGSGARTVFAIHCSLAHSGAWRELSRCLGGQAAILAMDMPCHGRSDMWDGTGDLHDCVTAEALKAMQALDGKIDLLGHSFGASVALRAACLAPENVRSVILFDCVWFAAADGHPPQVFSDYAERNAPFAEAFAKGDMMEAARAFNRAWGDGTRWADIPEKTRHYMAERIHFVHHSAPFVEDDSAGLLQSGLLERLDIPVLLLAGGQSDPTIGAVHSALAKRLPRATSRVLPGVGHMGPITHPQEVADDIIAFWETSSLSKNDRN